MCTSGWIRTTKGWILFKNRDRLPQEKEEISNEIVTEGNVVVLRDQIFGGCWFGTNGEISISDTAGPCEFVQPGRTPENELFLLNKEVLEKETSLEPAVRMYCDEFRRRRIGQSYNVLVCDGRDAVVIEMCEDDISVLAIREMICRTNHFLDLEKYNDDPKSLKRSSARLVNAENVLRESATLADVKRLCRNHAKENLGVCRHYTSDENGVTIASAILEFNGELALHTVLNMPPCEKEYETMHIHM